MINRVLASSDPSSDNTFLHKWSKRVGGKVHSKRQELFDPVTHWWGHSPILEELQRETHALAFSGLMMLCPAPTLLCNDHWVHYLTGHPVIWIPTHHCRLLPINVLLQLLCSPLGTLMLTEWSDAHWDNPFLEDSEVLHVSTNFFPEEASILQLKEVDGVQTLVAGSPEICY